MIRASFALVLELLAHIIHEARGLLVWFLDAAYAILKVVLLIYVVHLAVDLNNLPALAGQVFRSFTASAQKPAPRDNGFCIALPPQGSI